MSESMIFFYNAKGGGLRKYRQDTGTVAYHPEWLGMGNLNRWQGESRMGN